LLDNHKFGRIKRWEERAMSKAQVVVLEGTWWSNQEVPLLLPYFHALSISHRDIDLSHRTIRSVEDIGYYVFGFSALFKVTDGAALFPERLRG
jgi:hypothetical protein